MHTSRRSDALRRSIRRANAPAAKRRNASKTSRASLRKHPRQLPWTPKTSGGANRTGGTGVAIDHRRAIDTTSERAAASGDRRPRSRVPGRQRPRTATNADEVAATRANPNQPVLTDSLIAVEPGQLARVRTNQVSPVLSSSNPFAVGGRSSGFGRRDCDRFVRNRTTTSRLSIGSEHHARMGPVWRMGQRENANVRATDTRPKSRDIDLGSMGTRRSKQDRDILRFDRSIFLPTVSDHVRFFHRRGSASPSNPSRLSAWQLAR